MVTNSCRSTAHQLKHITFGENSDQRHNSDQRTKTSHQLLLPRGYATYFHDGLTFKKTRPRAWCHASCILRTLLNVIHLRRNNFADQACVKVSCDLLPRNCRKRRRRYVLTSYVLCDGHVFQENQPQSRFSHKVIPWPCFTREYELWTLLNEQVSILEVTVASETILIFRHNKHDQNG